MIVEFYFVFYRNKYVGSIYFFLVFVCVVNENVFDLEVIWNLKYNIDY